MNKVFIGYDSRQPLAFTVAAHSVIVNSSEPVAVIPLMIEQLPIGRRGLTEFTFSRFLVPYLSDYEGYSIFIDPDVVVTGDVTELFNLPFGPSQLLNTQVYVMQQQPRFEWPSVMLFNNGECGVLTPDYIDEAGQNPLDLKWATRIGNMPPSWNYCVGIQPELVGSEPVPKLIHFTEGLPCWAETMGSQLDSVWRETQSDAMRTCDWFELMGRSVHAPKTLRRFLARRGVNTEWKNGE